MGVSRPHNVPDPLEMAHLAYMRGDLATARSIIDELLLAEPQNDEACRFRNALEREIVERQAATIRSQGWLARQQPTPMQTVGILLSGLSCIALAAYWAIWPVQLAFRYGLAAQIKHPIGIAVGGYATSPVHYLLAGPLLLGALGVFLVYSVIAFLRTLRDGSRRSMD